MPIIEEYVKFIHENKWKTLGSIRGEIPFIKSTKDFIEFVELDISLGGIPDSILTGALTTLSKAGWPDWEENKENMNSKIFIQLYKRNMSKTSLGKVASHSVITEEEYFKNFDILKNYYAEFKKNSDIKNNTNVMLINEISSVSVKSTSRIKEDRINENNGRFVLLSKSYTSNDVLSDVTAFDCFALLGLSYNEMQNTKGTEIFNNYCKKDPNFEKEFKERFLLVSSSRIHYIHQDKLLRKLEEGSNYTDPFYSELLNKLVSYEKRYMDPEVIRDIFNGTSDYRYGLYRSKKFLKILFASTVNSNISQTEFDKRKQHFESIMGCDSFQKYLEKYKNGELDELLKL